MNTTQFRAEALPMMAAVDAAMTRLFGSEPTEAYLRARLEQKEDEFIARKAKNGYFRICGENETLAEAASDAIRHNAALYLKRGRYFVSTDAVAGAQRIAPIFEPIRPLEQRA